MRRKLILVRLYRFGDVMSCLFGRLGVNIAHMVPPFAPILYLNPLRGTRRLIFQLVPQIIDTVRRSFYGSSASVLDSLFCPSDERSV